MAALEAGNGCGSSNVRKRKWPCEGCGQEFPGDPPTDDEAVILSDGVFRVITKDPTCSRANTFQSPLTFKGVTVKVVVEIKKFNGKTGDDFYTTITEPNDVELRQLLAAITHDLERLYWNPEHPAESLNVIRVEICIRMREDQLVGCCSIGKGLLDKFVDEKRATLPYAPRQGWVGLKGKDLGQLKDAIKAQSLEFLEILQAAIIEERSQGGRLKEEEHQIMAPIREDESPAKDLEDLDQLNLNEQITSLKATHAAETASAEAKHAALEAEIKSRKETVEKMRTAFGLTGSHEHPEANLLGLHDKIKRLESALEVKDIQLQNLHQLQKASGGCLYYSHHGPSSPTTGLMTRRDQEFPEDDD